jgi:hypothetical protein
VSARVLDVSDPAALEAALEALPEGQLVEVTCDAGAFGLVRVPGGWWLPGDLAIATADVVDGCPSRVEVRGLFGDDPVPTSDTDSEALLLLADVDPDEAADLRHYKRSKS